MKLINNIIQFVYYKFLWFAGAYDRDGNVKTVHDMDKITFWFRRSEERLGVLWYGLWIAAFLIIGKNLEWSRWGLILLLAFLIWLFIHILLPYDAPPNEFDNPGEI